MSENIYKLAITVLVLLPKATNSVYVSLTIHFKFQLLFNKRCIRQKHSTKHQRQLRKPYNMRHTMCGKEITSGSDIGSVFVFLTALDATLVII